MGRMLISYKPQDLREEQRNWAVLRLQYGCRDLINAAAWHQEGEKGRKPNEWMRSEMRAMMHACFTADDGGFKEISEEVLRSCEEWAQRKFNFHGGEL